MLLKLKIKKCLKESHYIDIVIGPQSYHKINKILKNLQKKKKIDETEFDTIAKFDYLEKIKNKIVKYHHF